MPNTLKDLPWLVATLKKNIPFMLFQWNGQSSNQLVNFKFTFCHQVTSKTINSFFLIVLNYLYCNVLCCIVLYCLVWHCIVVYSLKLGRFIFTLRLTLKHVHVCRLHQCKHNKLNILEYKWQNMSFESNKYCNDNHLTKTKRWHW